ncbi:MULTISPECIES: response regulator [unclassified Rhodococcus (in: high G+C Gram-positive bacteria)]|uniref:response regulator n=1 Tax=unclassified Rhodococcus (in: high G+C Gram-positive bacteria) TaxID=192944 RepID=UPI00146A3CE6|nr:MULTISPECIES: response regulator transcription factor [unclassified Rhodococcus (in: high G+C Gram-positive bacteria)]MBF0659937.1 response regulator transcription factor [Rhodococcus sp. (in: high G+C Gram-positive bacteria)]NMD97365.1 response regulator transcription factor [Rhodococcus sp. BL-253-APC-6A1W]NME80281.1 response regulator transcription factor [Rhodococcus sp. 105337]
MIRVVLVDDQALVREGLRALLERTDDIVVAGEADDGDAGVRVVTETRPDVVLMDIRMPGTDGIAATRRIIGDPALSHVHVVVLTTFDTDDNVLDAIRAGAVGFLVKDTAPGDLRNAIRTVAGGDAMLSPTVTRRVMQAAARGAGARDTGQLDGLTNREREILAEVGLGLSNEGIGSKLFISPATVRTHVTRILTKLRARDRAGLVAIAFRTGLVTPEDR